MPTYSIKAPNGQTYQIDGPAGASDDDVRAQVMAQHPDIGGAEPVPDSALPKIDQPAGDITPATSPMDAISRVSLDPSGNYVYDATDAPTPPAGPAAPTTEDKINASAKAHADFNAGKTGDFATGLRGGLVRNLGFGIPERLAAAAEKYLPSAITGNNSDASYDDILKLIRANTDADAGKDAGGNILGAVVGGGATAFGAAGAIGKAAGALAESGAPVAARVGNVLQELGTATKGDVAGNIAKGVIAGGSAGAAQAAGQGDDPLMGAASGVLGAAAFTGGAKVAQVVTRPIADILGLTSAPAIIKRLTSATVEQIRDRAAQYRAATGAEPTLFELLPLVDRNKLLKNTIVGKDNIVERASTAIRGRAANLGPEMSAHAQAIVGPQRQQIRQGIAADLANARGARATPEDLAMAHRATESPTDMEALRQHEANIRMDPHNDTPVAETFGDILPQHPETNGRGEVSMVDSDPQVTAAIRASVPGGFRAPDQGVNVRDVASMIRVLRKDLSKGGIEGNIAGRAISHLEDQLPADAAVAHSAMTDAYAARSRMLEGMKEGAATRLRNVAQVGTSGKAARTIRNAYDSEEGAGGRVLGQSNQVVHGLEGSPEDALRGTVDISRNGIGRELAQNIGPAESAGLTSAARAQDESAQALSAAAAASRSGEDANSAGGLAHALLGLHPGSFIATKANSIVRLVTTTHIPESRARTIVDMLFSQDPATMNRAMNALNRERGGKSFMTYLTGAVGDASAQGAHAATITPPEAPTDTAGGAFDIAPSPDGSTPATDADPFALEPAPEAPAETPAAAPADLPYGHRVISQLFPEAQITEDVRDPKSKLGRENENSYHVKSQNAVDVRPIKNMTFEGFIDRIHKAGYKLIEARNEVLHPVKYATGPHWHVVIAAG